jgi:hypothetical protein
LATFPPFRSSASLFKRADLLRELVNLVMRVEWKWLIRASQIACKVVFDPVRETNQIKLARSCACSCDQTTGGTRPNILRLLITSNYRTGSTAQRPIGAYSNRKNNNATQISFAPSN